MKQLATEFKDGTGGFIPQLDYKQLKRVGNLAIYSRSRHGKVFDYEVIRIIVVKAGTQVFAQVREEDEESYPGCAMFGRRAWSCANLSRAMSKFHEQLTKELEKQMASAQPEPDVVWPDGQFTRKQLVELNPTFQVGRLYQLLEEAIQDEQVVRDGETKPSKGKPALLYRCA
jgi:hypothetical protein